MTQVEIEYKSLLTKAEFDQLRTHFKNAKLIIQNNIYYKYKNPNIKIACRIREKDGQATLTFKQDHTIGRLETNFKKIDKHSDFFAREDVKAFLIENGFTESFDPIGALLTYRYQILEEHQEICIDENHYDSIIDYELEVESIDSPESALDRFNELCEQFNIQKQTSISKFERYLKQKGL